MSGKLQLDTEMLGLVDQIKEAHLDIAAQERLLFALFLYVVSGLRDPVTPPSDVAAAIVEAARQIAVQAEAETPNSSVVERQEVVGKRLLRLLRHAGLDPIRPHVGRH